MNVTTFTHEGYREVDGGERRAAQGISRLDVDLAREIESAWAEAAATEQAKQDVAGEINVVRGPDPLRRLT